MFDLNAIDNSWTLFLDRDGVINFERNNDYVKAWDTLFPYTTLFRSRKSVV